MPKIKEITVSLDLTVQPKQYQSMKYGISATVQKSEDDSDLTDVDIEKMRKALGILIREGLHAEVEIVFGKTTADYVVNQTGAK